MFSTLRNRFGIPGVISVIALVFAMFGGAYAANNSGDGNGATASAKKAVKGPRGPKGPKGATGAAGPTGPAGAPGAKGDTGAAGTNGQNGAAGAKGKDGTNVTSAPFEGTNEPDGAECEEAGGVEFKSASPTTYACNGLNGEDGEPWTAGGTLPVGATETGNFSFSATLAGTPEFLSDKRYAVPISFPIPLSAPITEESHVVYVPAENTTTPHCSDSPINGTVEDPKAESGYLCLYGKENLGTLTYFFSVGPEFNPAGRSGTAAFFNITKDTVAYGSWAVTG